MNTPPIVDPRLTARLSTDGFFPSTAAIQQNTPVANDYGGLADAWATVTGLGALACAVARARRPASSERRDPQFVEVISTHEITLPTCHPEITPAMRAVIGATTYDILVVHTDSQAQTTLLYVRTVTT